MKKSFKKVYCAVSLIFACAVVIFTIGFSFFRPNEAYAATFDTTDITEDFTEPTGATADAGSDITNGFSIIYNNDSGAVSTPIRMLLVLTILTLAPSILIMMTSFTRIIIVLHFVRTAIGTQTAPPNQVLVGLALFLTFFITYFLIMR